jgi:hypothetical protein
MQVEMVRRDPVVLKDQWALRVVMDVTVLEESKVLKVQGGIQDYQVYRVLLED